MVTKNDLALIKQWFEMYVHQFCTGNERIDSALCLKFRHTKNVAREILDIADSIAINADDRYLAEIIAILHDIGRFEQYMKYHTYSDRNSENHAKLGLEIIEKTEVLKKINIQDQKVITTVIAYHNLATLPKRIDLGNETSHLNNNPDPYPDILETPSNEGFSEHNSNSRALFFLKLLRDADKIDILRVVTDHYSGANRNDAINIDLPDAPQISTFIINDILNGKNAKMEDVKTLNDFKLLQIGWIFDINFPKTYDIVKNRQYLDKLAATLPKIANVEKAISVARQHEALQTAGIVTR